MFLWWYMDFIEFHFSTESVLNLIICSNLKIHQHEIFVKNLSTTIGAFLWYDRCSTGTIHLKFINLAEYYVSSGLKRNIIIKDNLSNCTVQGRIVVMEEIDSDTLIEAYLAGNTKASNSVIKWRRIILLDCGMPSAIAMVSPLNEGSRTTNPPWTPLSVIKTHLVKSRTGQVKKYTNL